MVSGVQPGHDSVFERSGMRSQEDDVTYIKARRKPLSWRESSDRGFKHRPG